MSKQADLTYKEGLLTISGDVTFDTVVDLHKQLPKHFDEDLDTIDCQGIDHADSSAISFLLAILRICKPQQPTVINLNPSLSTLAKLYGVDPILFP